MELVVNNILKARIIVGKKIKEWTIFLRIKIKIKGASVYKALIIVVITASKSNKA